MCGITGISLSSNHTLNSADLRAYAQGLHIMGSTMTRNMTSGVPVVMVVP